MPTTPEGTNVDPVRLALIITHGVGLLLVVVGILAQTARLRRNAGQVTGWLLGGAGLLLVSGLSLATMMVAFGTPNWPKLAVKLVIAVSILVGLLVHRGRPASTGMLLGMLGLTLVNTAIAVAW